MSRTARQPDLYSQLCDLDERVWEVFRTHARERGAIEHGSQDYLIVRMVHIAEATSNAIRMNATWELTAATMSLVRDRYEQTVRFSWLVRNPDQEEYRRYERFMISKIRTVVRNIAPETVKRFTESGQALPLWVTTALTREERSYLEEWEKLDLCSMAAKRDSFPPIADNRLSKEKLQPWYNAVYRQFSSISHYDRFAVEMVKPLRIKDQKVVLGFQPHWPKLLILYTTFLDIIQCYEITTVCFQTDTSIKFESLFLEWAAFAAQFNVGIETRIALPRLGDCYCGQPRHKIVHGAVLQAAILACSSSESPRWTTRTASARSVGTFWRSV